MYKTFDPKYTNPQYEDNSRYKNNERDLSRPAE